MVEIYELFQASYHELYSMEIAVVTEGVDKSAVANRPWISYHRALAKKQIFIRTYQGNYQDAFQRSFDVMLLDVWLDWWNKKRFDPYRIMPLLVAYSTYRAQFPETIQIIHESTDMSRRPYATPYWRPGDPILYRTPAYNRSELFPYPPEQIWPYEKIWGSPCFTVNSQIKYQAGFIGAPNGPKGYRQAVAEQTAKVGIGICESPHPYSKTQHNRLMAECQIIVCPRGWGEQSRRHWDAWFSGKPVLTDRECDSVEMIPGVRLKEGVHYLVFDTPKQIPDLVSDWTRTSRLDDLKKIGENGRKAACAYDGAARILDFFERVVSGKGCINALQHRENR